MRVKEMLLLSVVYGAAALAQAPQRTADFAGVWRGTSLCLVHPSPCHDETVVYRITRRNTVDGYSVDAFKIVGGEEQSMGVLDCRVTTPAPRLTCAIPRGTWLLAVHGDSLTGELRLADNTKFRDVRAARSR